MPIKYVSTPSESISILHTKSLGGYIVHLSELYINLDLILDWYIVILLKEIYRQSNFVNKF